MQSSAELKRQAKESLKGRWGQAVLLNLIPTLIGIAAILLIIDGIPFTQKRKNPSLLGCQ